MANEQMTIRTKINEWRNKLIQTVDDEFSRRNYYAKRIVFDDPINALKLGILAELFDKESNMPDEKHIAYLDLADYYMERLNL